MKYHAGLVIAIGILLIGQVGGCVSQPRAGKILHRRGDEIVIAGQFVHTGAPVVLWMDPGGYDAYRTERRFAPWEKASFAATTQEVKDIDTPNRYNIRFAPSTRPSTQPRGDELTPEQFEQVRGGGWDLKLLADKVDQFVIHYDVCGTSRQCFNILHDHRGLSVHFMLDVDGTIYQTLDVKERAWHATKANSRSVGIEIANIGAYPPDRSTVLDQWYRRDQSGRTRMVLPAWMKQEWIRTPNFVARPIRDEPVIGQIQGREYKMYDLTPQQYDSLIKLTAALCKTLPKIRCDYPRDQDGKLIPHVLTDEQYEQYQGVLGHFHVQANKQDPGPAFQWDRVIHGARKLMK
ncbi:N-acetylmuramoyl-L-alanine amidase [Fontivita pretiosa]|uniref:N-acetylmuramoyl-L-alanine amidase n=1 Tax=Fontivita pretiosa TaxID=2989684 RepID=UPI003D173483